jgi:hypothetical protein
MQLERPLVLRARLGDERIALVAAHRLDEAEAIHPRKIGRHLLQRHGAPKLLHVRRLPHRHHGAAQPHQSVYRLGQPPAQLHLQLLGGLAELAVADLLSIGAGARHHPGGERTSNGEHGNRTGDRAEQYSLSGYHRDPSVRTECLPGLAAAPPGQVRGRTSGSSAHAAPAGVAARCAGSTARRFGQAAVSGIRASLDGCRRSIG